jgi:hypothetical protein
MPERAAEAITFGPTARVTQIQYWMVGNRKIDCSHEREPCIECYGILPLTSKAKICSTACLLLAFVFLASAALVVSSS